MYQSQIIYHFHFRALCVSVWAEWECPLVGWMVDMYSVQYMHAWCYSHTHTHTQTQCWALLLPQMLSFLLIVRLSRLRPTVLLQSVSTNTDTVAQHSAQVGVPAQWALMFFNFIFEIFISFCHTELHRQGLFSVYIHIHTLHMALMESWQSCGFKIKDCLRPSLHPQSKDLEERV